MRRRTFLAPLLAALLLPANVAAQSPATDEEIAGQVVPPTITSTVRNQFGFGFPEAPATPSGPADPELVEDIDRLFGSLQDGIDTTALTDIATSEDPRAAWLISDLLLSLIHI